MKRYLKAVCGICLLTAGSLHSHASTIKQALVDPNATGETRILYTNMKNLSKESIMFGHQNTNVEGFNVSVPPNSNGNQSDVFTGTGSFPAVFGFDFIVGSERAIVLSQMPPLVASAYAKGAIITFSWSANNPVTGQRFDDKSGKPVQGILSGSGTGYTNYIAKLDEIAAFAKQAAVPIIFRPLHENTGDWFWWGTSNSNPIEFKALWRLTVEYLRDTKGVHNFLYAYSPSDGVYDSRYPGDDYVDIIGADVYKRGNFSSDILNVSKTIVNLANAKGKVAALTEVGPRDGFGDPQAQDNFYTNVLLNTLKNDATARQISYALVWRNSSLPGHFWVPVQTDSAFNDFVSFYNDKFSVFTENLPDMYNAVTTSTRGWPYCSNVVSDPDNDGWGWENNISCVISGGAADITYGNARGPYSYCVPNLQAHETDGDGWGWQYNASCIVPGSPADPQANW